MLVPHQELPAVEGPQPMEGEGLPIRSAVCTRSFPWRSWWVCVIPFGFPPDTRACDFAAVVATASGGADGGREHCRKPAGRGPTDVAVHLDNRELHSAQHQEALLRRVCRRGIQMVSVGSLAFVVLRETWLMLTTICHVFNGCAAFGL